MKKRIPEINVLYPFPVVLCGAMVDGRPNFDTIAHVGVLTHKDPALITLSMGKAHSTTEGIRENRAFSVNLPGADMVEKVDYCGMVSGRDADKAGLFRVFFGELKTAPLIKECPVNMECRLFDVIDLPNHDAFIGEITAVHADEPVLSDGLPDLARVNPLLFDMNGKQYLRIGQTVGKGWCAGKALMKK